MQRTCGYKDKDVTNRVMLTCVILTLWVMLWYFALFLFLHFLTSPDTMQANVM